MIDRRLPHAAQQDPRQLPTCIVPYEATSSRDANGGMKQSDLERRVPSDLGKRKQSQKREIFRKREQSQKREKPGKPITQDPPSETVITEGDGRYGSAAALH